MKLAPIKVLKLKVARFLPKDGLVEFAITYSNETTKEILKTDKVSYPESLARRILAEVRKTVKSAHKVWDDGELREMEADVVIDREDALVRQMTTFLETIRVKAEVVRHMKTADGYMDAVRSVNRMELILK